MKPVLVAILLAFAAPAPVAEPACGLEEEVFLESGRSPKSSPVRTPFRTALRQEQTVPAPRPSLRDVGAARPPRDSSGWAPRLFSRPPPPL